MLICRVHNKIVAMDRKMYRLLGFVALLIFNQIQNGIFRCGRLCYLSPLLQSPHWKIFPENRPQDSKIEFQLTKTTQQNPGFENWDNSFRFDLGRRNGEYFSMGNRKEKGGCSLISCVCLCWEMLYICGVEYFS